MHLAGRMGGRQLLITLALLAALVCAGLVGAAAVRAAPAADFTGGPSDGDYPLYVPNDYTVCALRFSASGLLDANGQPAAAGTQYYVKIRLNTTPAPNGTSNRGWTWNDQTHAWVQERDGTWSHFPTITSDAPGAITAGTRWFFFRFGDTTMSGTYYLMVSLQPVGGGSGTTQNSATKPAVTVLDMAGSIPGAPKGFRIHNGLAQSNAGNRIEADASGASTVWAISRTEKTGSDDPASYGGENYGPAGIDGDFSLGVPAGSAFDVKAENAAWPAGASGFTGSVTDVDIAYGAADQTPPTRPGPLNVEPRNGGAVISWPAATDDAGVTGYAIYRWQDAPAGVSYTAEPVRVGTVGGGTLTYTDSGLTNGQVYRYQVRAMDEATNIGPGSAVAGVTADGTPPGSVTGFTATAVAGGRVALSWSEPSDGDFVGTKVLRTVGPAPTGPDDPAAVVVYDGSPAGTTDTTTVDGTTYTYAAYAYDLAGNFAPAATATVTADGTPPAGVTGLTATVTVGAVTLTWADPQDADYSGTLVLRKEGQAPSAWDDPSATTVYDGPGTLASDGAVTSGTHYFYAVYAYDHAGNRSAVAGVDVTAAGSATQLTLLVPVRVVDWGKQCAFTAQLSSAGQKVPGAVTVDLQKSTNGQTWTFVKKVQPQAGTSTYSGLLGPPTQKTYYRLWFHGTAEYASAYSPAVTLTPRVKLGTPVAPKTVKKGHSFAVYGSLAPKQTPGSRTVRVKVYRRSSGHWVLKKTVAATNVTYKSGSRYTVRLSLSAHGSWKLVAYSAATPKFAATTSGARTLTVK